MNAKRKSLMIHQTAPSLMTLGDFDGLVSYNR